jgi:transposase-like protein
MCYEEVACPRCSSLRVKKNGITTQPKQRYRCQDCERQFITDYTYQAYKPEVRSLVLPMTLNGSGIRDISRVLHISTNTIELGKADVIRRVVLNGNWALAGACIKAWRVLLRREHVSVILGET